ncbi:hypothetical protein FO519_005437 [Halicephalobus sp. NKZ332]|nr:hypothetical protein FO519_005437 [Halicephalobus sp. NKZ332]
MSEDFDIPHKVKRFMKLDICYLRKYVSISDWSILIIGCFLAAFTGVGLPHLVDVVGWILNIYIFVNPTSPEFHTKVSPLLIYFCAMAIMLAVIAFFQYMCFRICALKISRRVRRACFRKALYQNLEFFGTDIPDEILKSFEADTKELTTAIGDSFPNIVTTIVQFAVAIITAYTLTWRLSIAMTVFGILVCGWVLLFNWLIKRQAAKEKLLESRFKEAVDSREDFEDHLRKSQKAGIVKGFLNGTLTGSLQFFIFFGMAISAFYGNWLIDRKSLKWPGYLFVVCNTIIPAFIRLAQLPSQITTLSSASRVGRIMKLVEEGIEKGAMLEMLDLEDKRKAFLMNYIKAEVGSPKERLHHHKSPAFHRVRRTAFSLWYLYFAGFLFCGMVGVSAAAVTKMNGNMFEFYNKPDRQIYFPAGIQHAWRYVVVGFSILVSGSLMGIVFGYNSEKTVRRLREDLFDVAGNGFLEKPGLVALLTKFTGPCKAVFDHRLAVFWIGILSVICGVLSNIHKNLIYSFLTAVAYSLQTVAQFFVFRFADIHANHAKKASMKRGIKLLEKLESMPASEVDARQHEISKDHNRYLSFQFHKETSNVVAQAFRFSFTVAVPQVTQSFVYSIGTFLIFDEHIRPITVYKIVGTIHASVAVVANLATFPSEVYNSRLAAQHIDEVIPLANFSVEDGSSRKSSTSSTDSVD